MIAYHGSNSNFKTLRIAKNLVHSSGTMLNEGMGIYFSLRQDVASSYGKYLYVLDVADSWVNDFRKIGVCRTYINSICNHILKVIGLDISRFFSCNLVAQYVCEGRVAVSGVGHEIQLNLDSSGDWYERVSPAKIEAVWKLLDYYDKNCPKVFLFNYNIPDCGVIKDVSSEIVVIQQKLKIR